MIYKAISDEQILSCFDVMAELRPHLIKENFIKQVRANETVVAVAGYRIYSNLAFGKHLYVDDLVSSSSARSKGYGEELLNWLKAAARASECRYFILDSGTHRHQAHKFYFRNNLTINSYHFVEELK